MSNAGGMHLTRGIRSFCSGACLLAAPPQRVFDQIADFVVNEGQSSRAVLPTSFTGAQPTPPRRSLPVCSAGRETIADSSVVAGLQ